MSDYNEYTELTGKVGTHDVVINGKLITNIPNKVVFVLSEAVLNTLPDTYPIGSMACTYDLTQKWIKTPHAGGAWQEV